MRVFGLLFLLLSLCATAQQPAYPKNYFRHPLNIPMELVANFGELRNNHWHMGLDIRTQQRENLPVYAAAEGYISRIKIEPGGFGRALYIAHPNGLTTLYAHLNNFEPTLERWVREQQYALQSWAVELTPDPSLFPLQKGDFIAYSGNTGGSAGPHVHFEIRETATDKCLNPLLFGFPIPDKVPPTLVRLALYDRSRPVYTVSPQLLSLRKSGLFYVPSGGGVVRPGTDRISLALGAVDRFSGSTNPNGIYSARVFLDGALQSEFVLDSISYDETRYMNAHIDYRYRSGGGAWLQHLSPLPGDTTTVYRATGTDGVLQLQPGRTHEVQIEVRDAAQNVSTVRFTVAGAVPAERNREGTWLVPGEVNVWEAEGFEVYTSEYAVYDSLPLTYRQAPSARADARSPEHFFMTAALPLHDSITVRIHAPGLSAEARERAVIRSVSGTRTVIEKVRWSGDWATARFRQWGSFTVLEDRQDPAVNAPVTNLRTATRLVFTPTDNLASIRSFRATVNGQWLRFTNDKGRTWIYAFDERFPKGASELQVEVEDEAGNRTVRRWTVTR